MTLRVLLHGAHVGDLEKQADASVSFQFSAAYRGASPRHVLSQSFEDDLRARSVGPSPLLPPFFSNLLPEAALRSFVLKQHRLDDRDEYGLISVLGQDLPGAVEVLPEGATVQLKLVIPASAHAATTTTRVRFSLGGQFLKFSARVEGQRVVLPVEGAGGDYLLKLPDRAFPALCELEWLVTEWARRAGVSVPTQRLVPEQDIEGVDRALLRLGPGEARALLAARFDRTPGATRVHYEDFAQARGVYGDDTQKYAGDYAELVALVAALCPEDLRELVRRLVFMVMSGNGDAHWKNWALTYPDGQRPRLSPAYDLVATVAYPSLAKETALAYMGRRGFGELTPAHLASIARAAQLSEAEVGMWISEDVQAIRGAWGSFTPDEKLTCELAFRVDDHLRGLGW